MGLYSESRNYLIRQLKRAGVKTKVHTTHKSLSRSQESHLGAVVFEREGISRTHATKRYRDDQGNLMKRKKVFDRKPVFMVTIGEYTDEAAEAILENLLSDLATGLTIGGNYVPIEVEGADWVYEEDSILKAKVGVQVRIRFDGGIYRDTGFRKAKDLVVEAGKTIDRKEPTDGSEQ